MWITYNIHKVNYNILKQVIWTLYTKVVLFVNYITKFLSFLPIVIVILTNLLVLFKVYQMIKISYKNIKNVRVLWQLLWTCLNFIDDKCFLVEVHIRRKQMNNSRVGPTSPNKTKQTKEAKLSSLKLNIQITKRQRIKLEEKNK